MVQQTKYCKYYHYYHYSIIKLVNFKRMTPGRSRLTLLTVSGKKTREKFDPGFQGSSTGIRKANISVWKSASHLRVKKKDALSGPKWILHIGKKNFFNLARLFKLPWHSLNLITIAMLQIISFESNNDTTRIKLFSTW